MKKVLFAGLTLSLLAAACAATPPAPSPSPQARIISFVIEPSRKQDNWLTYTTGAAAILKAENIQSAEIRYLPTGTGSGLEYPEGKLLGEMKKHADGSYRLALPSALTTTNFWVQVKDRNGKVIKGPDLGNVAAEEESEK